MKRILCDINSFAFNQCLHLVDETDHKLIHTTFDELAPTIAELVQNADIEHVLLNGPMAETIDYELKYELGNTYNLIKVEVVK